MNFVSSSKEQKKQNKKLKVVFSAILRFIIIALLLVQVSPIKSVEATNAEFTPQVVSDSEIQDFLEKFIASSVANVQMLVEFVTKLLRDSIGSTPYKLPGNINKSIILCRL